MKPIDLNSLLDDDRVIILGDKEIKIDKLTVNKSLRAIEYYQDVQDFIDSETEKFKNKYKDSKKTDTEIQTIILSKPKNARKHLGGLIRASLFIIRPLGFFNKLKLFFSKNWISKKYLFNKCSITQLTGFIEEVIRPLLAEKKTMM